MKVEEFTRGKTITFSCLSTCHPCFGGIWANGYEDHRLGVEIGRRSGVDDLAVLVDINRENSIRGTGGGTELAATAEWGRDDVRIAGIGLQVDSGALEVARDPEAFQLVVGGLQEIGQDVVELDHPDIGAGVFGRLCAVNSVPSRVNRIGDLGA